MTSVSELNGEIVPYIKDRDVIVFDGVCGFCSGFFYFMLKHDRNQRFFFATAQSFVGQDLYATLGLPMDDFETNLVIVDGVIYQRLDAFAAAMGAIGWPWRILSWLRFLPPFAKDPAYHLIARNRYRLFGRRETCMMPTPEIQDRFITMPQEKGAP